MKTKPKRIVMIPIPKIKSLETEEHYAAAREALDKAINAQPMTGPTTLEIRWLAGRKN
jgi:hypothetical protein